MRRPSTAVFCAMAVSAALSSTAVRASDPKNPGPAPAAPAAAAPAPAAPAAADPAEQEKVLFTLGVLIGKRITGFDLTQKELDSVAAGLREGAVGAPEKYPIEQYGPKVDELFRARSSRRAELEKEKGKAFAEKTAKDARNAQVTPSGLVYIEEKAGTGASPRPEDKVSVHYRGTLIDGKEFDSSYKRNAPADFGLNQVIACWTEGLQKMKVGGKARLVCPSSIAYGDAGQRDIPAGATLVFEVELLDIKK